MGINNVPSEIIINPHYSLIDQVPNSSCEEISLYPHLLGKWYGHSDLGRCRFLKNERTNTKIGTIAKRFIGTKQAHFN